MLGRHIAQIASQTSFAQDSFVEAPSHAARVEAPPIGGTLMFRYGPLVEGSLTLTNETTGALYVANTDYFEVKEGGFENVTIPEGTPLVAEYFYHDAASDEAILPAEEWRSVTLLSGWAGDAEVYREGSRAWMRGEVSGGLVDVGSPVFSVETDLAPERDVPLATLSDGGPVRLDLSASGVASIGDSVFVAEGRLIVEGLSWRCLEGAVYAPTWESDLTWQSATTWESEG